MTTTISREYWFSAAHRLEGHPKCGRLHGHNYRVVITVTGHLNAYGMVMDYGDLDKVVKPIIDGLYDHRYISSAQNRAADDPITSIADEFGWTYRLEAPSSTAEHISRDIYELINLDLIINSGLSNIVGLEVSVDETHRSSATYPI